MSKMINGTKWVRKAVRGTCEEGFLSGGRELLSIRRMLRRLLGERTGLVAGKVGRGHNYTQLGEIQFCLFTFLLWYWWPIVFFYYWMQAYQKNVKKVIQNTRFFMNDFEVYCNETLTWDLVQQPWHIVCSQTMFIAPLKANKWWHF